MKKLKKCRVHKMENTTICMLKKGNEIAVVNYGIVEYSEIKHAEIEIIASRFSEKEKFSDGYKETLVTWLSSRCQVVSNNDIPINEEIAAALDMILHQIKCARIDRSVDMLALWMKRRTEV